jgi:hypothetical protein
MLSAQLVYDSTVNPEEPDILTRLPMTSPFFKATRDALPWRDVTDGARGMKALPTLALQSLCRKASVISSQGLDQIPIPSAFLHIIPICSLLDAMIASGLLTDEDGDPVEFETWEELQLAADAAIDRLGGDPAVYIDESDFVEADRIGSGPAEFHLLYLNAFTLDHVVTEGENLVQLTELQVAMGGQHFTANGRKSAEFDYLFGLSGIFVPALADFLSAGTVSAAEARNNPAPFFKQIRRALTDTTWPALFQCVGWPEDLDHVWEWGRRMKWTRASAIDVVSFLSARMKFAMTRSKLPTLSKLFHDSINSPHILVRDIKRVASAFLPSGVDLDYVLLSLADIETVVRDHCNGIVVNGFDRGESTQDILQKVLASKKVNADKEHATGASFAHDDAKIDSDGAAPPKRSQIAKALHGDAEYQLFEAKWKPLLQEPGRPNVKYLDLFGDAFALDNVVPKAVLFAGDGVRMSRYTDCSDFLGMLHDERDRLGYHLGQGVAYDEEEEEVPENLKHYELPKSEVDLLRSGKWASRVPVDLMFQVTGEDAGTDVSMTDSHHALRDATVTSLFIETEDKLYKSLSYPSKVDKGVGVSYRDFMKSLQYFQLKSLAMSPNEREGMNKLIEQWHDEGVNIAAANWKNTIYGANPSDKKVLAWLPRGCTLLDRIKDAKGQLKKEQEKHSKLPGVFGTRPQSTITMMTTVSSGASTSNVGSGGARKPPSGGGKKAPAAPGGGDVSSLWKGILAKPREEQVKLNAKRVFMYTDGTFSAQIRHINWPGICSLYGWKPEEVCGPYVMSFANKKNRILACVNPSHKYAPPCARAFEPRPPESGWL